ncbi:MAG: hypothetical protein ACREVE_08720 [Gammaproteobacteria bacterium]
MKQQYFGDVNDYLKYGVLRCCVTSGFRLGVCWMLTPPDDRTDGRKLVYLERPDEWRPHDPTLFDLLRSTLKRAGGRHVRHAEQKLLQGSHFFGDVVPDALNARAEWFRAARAKLASSDLIFFDPDNGIEVASKACGRKNSSKYVYWHELAASWNDGASLLVFQHFSRLKRDEHIAQLRSRLLAHAPAANVVPLRSANVLFLLAYRKAHATRAKRMMNMLSSQWSGRIWNHVAA